MAAKKGKKDGSENELDLTSSEKMERRMDQLRSLNIPVNSIKKRMTTYKKELKKGDKGVKKSGEELEELLDEGWIEWREQRNTMIRDLLIWILNDLDEKEVDTSAFRTRLGKLEGSKKGPDQVKKSIDGVLSDIESISEGYPELLSSETLTSFDKALNAFEGITGSKTDLPKHKKYFKKIKTLLKKGDVKNILVYSNLLYTIVKNEGIDDISKDRFKVIKDELEKMIETMKDFKRLGLGEESISKQLDRLNKGLDPSNVIEAQSALSRLAKSISRTEKEYFRRKGNLSIFDAQDLIDEYGPLINLSDQMKRLEELKDDVTTHPPKKFMDEGQKVLTDIKDILFENFEEQANQRLKTVDRDLEGAAGLTDNDRSNIMDLRTSTISSLENRNITEAMEYLSMAESIFTKADGEMSLESSKNRYIGLLDDIEGFLAKNIEIDEINNEILKIGQMFLLEDLKLDSVMAEVDVAEGMVREKKKEIRIEDFDHENSRIRNLLDNVDIKTEKKGNMIKRLEEIEGLLTDIEDDDYSEKLTLIRSDLDKEMSEYYRDNYNSWVTNIQGSMDSTDIEPEITTHLEKKIEDAGILYRDREYLSSGGLLKEVNDQIHEIQDQKDLDEAEALINSAEFLFEEANRAGVDVKDQTGLLIEAKNLLRNGDYRASKNIASRIESSVKSKWMESKKGHIREDLDGLKDYFMESNELGLDIDDASDLLEEAETYFEKEMYDEVNDMVYQAKETIDQKRQDYFSNGAMDTISTLKNEIGQLSDIGISTIEAETLMIEAERLFMEEKYEKAYSMTLDIKEHLNFSKGSYLKEEVPKKMEVIAKKVGKLEVMGLDTELARSYLNEATGHMDDGDLISTVDGLNKAEDISNEVYRSQVSLTIPETLVDVQKQIDHAIAKGLELDDVTGLLKEAEDLFNNENYDQALETIEKVQEDFKNRKDDFYKDKYLNNIDHVNKIMEKTVGMDNEVDLSRDNINMAKDAFERGDFEISHKLMGKVIKFLEGSFDQKETSKRREIVQTYYDEVRTLLTVAQAENIDISDETDMFSLAGELLVKADFDQAEHVLEGIKIGLNEKRVQMKKRLMESSIQTTEILLANMRDMGVDTTFEEKLIRELKVALRRGDLDRCDEINLQIQDVLHRNQGPYIVQKVQRDLSELKGKMVEAHSKGIEVINIQDKLTISNELFERGDLDGAMSEIENGRELLDEASRAYEQKEYRDLLVELEKQVQQLKQMGIPTEDEEYMVSVAQEALDKSQFMDATAYLETALLGANAKLNSFQRTTAEGYMQQIESYFEELSSRDIDISNLVKIYEEGKELHTQGEDKKAVSKFSSILELGEEIRVMNEVDSLRDVLETQKALYSDLREIGIKKMTKLEKVFTRADKLLSVDPVDIVVLSKILEKTDKILKKKAEPKMADLVKKYISSATSGIKEMQADAEESDQLKAKIKKAAVMLRSGELAEANIEIRDVLRSIEKTKLDETESLLGKEVASVKQMLTKLKTLGSNVSNSEKLLSRAKQALLDGKIENAEKLIKSVRTSVKDIVKRNMRETSLETIEFVDAMIHYLIDNFSGVSKKLGPSENKLDEARNMFKNKKFKAAKTKAEEARAEVEKIDIANIQQFFYVFRSSQATEMSRNVEIGIAELKNKGIDTSKVSLLFDKAREHFEKDEFDKGRQMITLAKIMLSEIDQQSLRDSAFDEMNNAHVEILTKKRKGIDTSGANRIYNKAKEAFSLREYKKAILLSKKAGHQIRKA